MNPGWWMFWTHVAVATLCLFGAAAQWWRRSYELAAVLAVCLAVNAWVAGKLAGNVFGECAGAWGTTVHYHEGMTLCPGQSATLTIEIPVEPPVPTPATERGL
jgi:hypothetical protein